MKTREGAAGWVRADPLVPAWLLVTVVVWAVYGFLGDLRRDAGLYAYAGQMVADGEPPYVAVMNRAGPLAHLLPGLGVGLGRATGMGDVVGARVLLFVLAALTPALVYLLTRTAFRSRLAGCAAAAVTLSFAPLAKLAVDGPESKVPMVMLLSVALLLTLQRRQLLAGVAAGLATLCWQPVLFVAAPAALVMALTASGGWRPRLREAGRYALGGLLVLVVAVGYFLAVGAIGPFYDGFWQANAGYTDQLGLLDRPAAVMRLAGNVRAWPLLAGCLLSLCLAAWALRGRPPGGADPEWRSRVLALGAATLAGVGWCLRAFDRIPDALLVLPPAAAGVGGTVALLVSFTAGSPRARINLVGVVTAVVGLAVASTLYLNLTQRDTRLDPERELARAIFDALPADATAMSIEAPQPFVLAGRRSISRYHIFGHGIPSWIEDEWPGGTDGYVAWVRDEAPTMIIVGTRGLKPFLHPIRADYDPAGDVRRGWRVLLHEDVDPGVRQAVAEVMTNPYRRSADRP